VRYGADAWLPASRGDPNHTYFTVHGEMLLQICRDYAGLPDYRTLSASEVRFFYNGLRHDLYLRTKPAPPPKKPRR
jgi:hypothetical protein